MSRRDPARLGPLATLAAWLRLWTPPRGARVPPVPWRALGLGAVVAGIALALVVAVAAPRIEASKERRAAAESAARDERLARARRRIALEQRARRGAAPGLDPPEALAPAEERRVREALVERAARDVGRDARARVDRGLLEGPILRVACEPYPRGLEPSGAERDLSRSRGAYECVAVTDDVAGGRGAIGHPFRVIVDFASRSYAWCKVNPVAGERAVPDPRRLVPLPRACRLGDDP